MKLLLSLSLSPSITDHACKPAAAAGDDEDEDEDDEDDAQVRDACVTVCCLLSRGVRCTLNDQVK